MTYEAAQALRSTGLLHVFNAAGVLSAADVHVAERLGRLGRENREEVLLAAALAVRGVRAGSVCIDLTQVRHTLPDDDSVVDSAALPWPEPPAWLDACAGSLLVAAGVQERWRPLRLVDGLLYLDRYWRQEQTVRAELDAADERPPPVVDQAVLAASLARLFPGPAPDRQRLAAALVALRWTSVLAGGPGTGKTTTVARVLALLADQPGPALRVALCAPTGKAAARLQEAVQAAAPGLGLPELTASTIHRLLGWRPDSRSRFRHDRTHHLPHDVVVVDETSMVSLTLMSRLLEAVRPDARLLLVGDPDQLASVEAGAVLGDLVARPALQRPVDPRIVELVGADLEPGEAASAGLRNGVVRLHRVHRHGDAIQALALAVRTGDGDEAVALLRAGVPELSFQEDDDVGDLRQDVLAAARPLVAAARRGDAVEALAALDRHRLLCAHRRGPYGVGQWAERIGRWLVEGIPAYGPGEDAAGRAVLVTTNDPELRIYNGDTGVVVAGPDGPRVAFARPDQPLLLSPGRLRDLQTVHATTVHRSQGSQFDRVTVLLPPPESPLLTRELLYTALTRAQEHVRVIGTEQAVRAAVARPVVRASGLRRVIPELA